MIHDTIQPRIFGYIGETINNKQHKTYIVNGMPDHIHILVGMNPSSSISDLVRDIKRSSSHFINENKLTDGHFQWQDGYGSFSYGKSQIPMIFNYINNQKLHHKTRKFREEYSGLLKRFEIPFDERFLFDFYD